MGKINTLLFGKTYENEEEFKYTNVGGWLLLFCLYIILVSPIVGIILDINNFKNIKEIKIDLSNNTNFMNMLGIGFIDIGLLIYGIYTGIALIKLRPRAVKIAKKYLLICLGIQILMITLIPQFIIVNPANLVKIALWRSIFIICWYFYFKRSVRVNLTYKIPVDTFKVSLKKKW